MTGRLQAKYGYTKEKAEKEADRWAWPYQAAMSMLNFYINRAGSNLSKERKAVLNEAKNELRKLFGRLQEE